MDPGLVKWVDELSMATAQKGSGLVGYQEKLLELRKKMDLAGSLDLLEGIFTAESNQKIRGKPTDYLHDDDDKLISPASGFKMVVDGFQPKMTIAEKVEYLRERMAEYEDNFDQLAMLFKPFNAITFKIGDYERCDTVANSGHFDPESGQFDRFYGLNHEIIFDGDSREDYDFVYELENGDQYELKLEGQEIAGKQLYYDLKIAVFGPHLLQIAQGLLESDWFAQRPKALPFYFFIQSADYRDESWLHPILVFKPESLTGHPQAQSLQASAAEQDQPTPEQTFDFLFSFAVQPQSAEYKQLIEHCTAHGPSFEKLLGLARRSLADGNGTMVGRLSGILWLLVDSYPELVSEFNGMVFERPFAEPVLESDRDRADPLRVYLSKGSDHVSMLSAAFKAVPPSHKDAIRPVFEKSLEQLVQADNPVLQIMAAEALTDGPPKDPPGSYLNALVSCVDLMPEQHTGYGGAWDFIMERLENLGPLAGAAIPSVLRVMERYSQNRVDAQILSYFGKVLYALGLEDVPQLIHQGYKQNQYMFDYYKDWSRMGPRRLVNEFSAAWKEDPKAFRQPVAWEERLHDSVVGFDKFAQHVESDDEVRATLLRAAQAPAGPGPLLSGLLCRLAERAKKNKDYPQVVGFLDPIDKLDDDHARDLKYSRLAILFRSMLDGEPEQGEVIHQLKQLYPEEGTLLYLDVMHSLKEQGVQRAVEVLVDSIKALSGHDLVYRKAFWKFTRDKDQVFAPNPGNAYAVLRATQIQFEKDNLSDGVFDGITKRFQKDPFYGMFYSVFGKLSEQELDEELAGYSDEYHFLISAHTLSDGQLLAHLNPERWQVALAVAERLVERANPEHCGALVELFEAVAEDESRALALSFLCWPSPIHQAALLGSSSFRSFLPRFIQRYPVRSDELIRQVVVALEQAGRQDAVCQLAFDLPDTSVVATFKSFLDAFIVQANFVGAIKLLKRIGDNMNDKKPEYTLVKSNLAVMHIQAGQLEQAEEVFDQLFATDFSRFDYKQSELTKEFSQVLGGDLELQLAQAHHTYFRMARFNHACLLAISDRPDQAMDSLRQAVALGHYTSERILAESDFESLRGRDDFQELVGALMEKEAER